MNSCDRADFVLLLLEDDLTFVAGFRILSEIDIGSTFLHCSCLEVPPPVCGAVAQLGERLNGIQEVVGSTPIGSTKMDVSSFSSVLV
jgi:hypothetical protein